MIWLFVAVVSLFSSESEVLFDFHSGCDLSQWYVVDDVVMGGRSDGGLSINEAGHGFFTGRVSLENNGGFSSMRFRCPQRSVNNFTKCVLRVKGDGKSYQFRVKSDVGQRHSYISSFDTTGDWQEVDIMLSEMTPAFRGMRLRIPNYPGEELEEIAILIGNKKAEKFALEIDWIQLR